MGDARLRDLARTWIRGADPAVSTAYQTELLRSYPGLIVEMGTLAVRLVHLSSWEGYGETEDLAWLGARTPSRLLSLGAALGPLLHEELGRLESEAVPGCQRLLALMCSRRVPPEDPLPKAWVSALELSRSQLLPSEGRLEAALGRLRFLIAEEGLSGDLLSVLLRATVVGKLGSQRAPYPDVGLLEIAEEFYGEQRRACLEVGRVACGWPRPGDDLNAALEAVRVHVTQQPYLLELGLPGRTADT